MPVDLLVTDGLVVTRSFHFTSYFELFANSPELER